jgi:TonB-linked SusC/RagA family outer membrane protein
VVGVQFSMNNGAPGGGAQVQIRGASSLIGRIEPLFIIDGVQVSNRQRATQQSIATGQLNAGEENATNRLADINPNDIESIEVLKGAAASAIYGSQATNGVVVIKTKRGSSGAPKFGVTQRVGTYQQIRKLGSRHIKDLTEALDLIGNNTEGIAVAKASCTPQCPYFDYQGELFGQTDPSYETVVNLSGGIGSGTRYFFSGLQRQEQGIALHTDAKRQSLRANLDQALSDQLTASISATVLRSFGQRGISNNDNSFASPMYAFAYTPAIFDLRARDSTGLYVRNPYPAGYKGSANPFQTFDLTQNNEDTYRQIASGRAQWTPYVSSRNNVNITLNSGIDQYSMTNYGLFPSTLQFQAPGSQLGGTLPGVAIQGDGVEKTQSTDLTGAWNLSATSWAQATTSGGLQYAENNNNDFNIIGRGLGPQQYDAAGATSTQVNHQRQLVRTQAFFGQEELLMFSEHLYLSGAIRGERSSVNGDPKKLFYYPRLSGSYRFTRPVKWVDELKLRANYGKSGNQPLYGQRFITISNYGLQGGISGYGQATTVGNTAIKPETMNEGEYGFDAGFLNNRVHGEYTYYNRRITDLLLQPAVAPSTGVNTVTTNGGEMDIQGHEVALSAVPIQHGLVEWSSHLSWQQNKSFIKSFPPGVLPFSIGGGGFGNSYGRLRFRPKTSISAIYGNFERADGSVKSDTILGDANPKYIMSFSNDFRYRHLSLNVLAEYRRGGTVSNMTMNLFDEGGNTWDYDKKSPDPAKPLGAYRYDTWNGGSQTNVYLVDGSYTKIREVNLSYDVPPSWYSRWNGVHNARLSLAARNLFIISGYNGMDPEVNNGGNRVARFVDLAPFPPSRSFFFSIDLGF